MSQQKHEVKVKSKDSVRTCLFQELKNVFRLYQELHCSRLFPIKLRLTACALGTALETTLVFGSKIA